MPLDRDSWEMRNRANRWRKAMKVERKEQSEESARSSRAILASLAALGGVGLASGCCLPLADFLLAAGTAGSSAFFVNVRPLLLAISALLIGFGFYQSRRAKQCQRRPSLLSAILLWFSAIVVALLILFPQAIANLLANALGG
jgi:hypothetical protein